MKIFPLLNKELKIAFSSATAYVTFTVFLLIVGYLFVGQSLMLAKESFAYGATGTSVMDAIFRVLFHDAAVILLFLTPAMTMRLLAEEKRAGTLELLLTYPLNDLEIILAKFCSAFASVVIFLLPTILYSIFIQRFAPIEWSVLATQYLGILLLCGSYIAVGLWASHLTDNQIVAATLTIGILLGLWLIAWIGQSSPLASWSVVLGQLSILNHFDSFSKGVLNTSDITFYLLLILFFLYVTLKGLESRSWWGRSE